MEEISQMNVGVNLRTVERWEKMDSLEDKRASRQFKPPNKLIKAEEDHALAVVNSARFCGLFSSQIIPILADEAIYIASESTLYRLLKRESQLVHRQKSQSRKHHKPKDLVATKPNQIWSWDITYLPSCVKGLFFYLYMIIDIYSRKIVGWIVSEHEASETASKFINEACQCEKITRNQVTLHSDNGSPMKATTLLVMLQKLGVVPSYSRPGVSNDNPFSESLFKTLKYNRFYPSQPFENLSNAIRWVRQFVDWYNYQHRHSAIQFVTPHQKHTGKDISLLMERKKIYEAARNKHPARWSNKTRNWVPVKLVCLNPDKAIKEQRHRADIQNLSVIKQSTILNRNVTFGDRTYTQIHRSVGP